MYMLLKNKNSCWDNNDKKGFLLFLTKQSLSGTRPISEIQIIFPMSRACGLGCWGFFSPDFLILAFILFFVLSFVFCLPGKQKSLVWPSTTGTSWNQDSDLAVLKMHFPVALREVNQKKSVRAASMSVVPKPRARAAFEAGLPRNVQAGYPHLQLLNCAGRAG